MSDTLPPKAESKPEDIPLEDIDRLLEAEDPEFTKSLDEVRAVANDLNVVIEAGAIDESIDGGEGPGLQKPVPQSLVGRMRLRLQIVFANARLGFKSRLSSALKDLLIFLKTRPLELFFFSLSTSKILFKKSLVPVHAFQNASRLQRIAALVLLATAVGSAWVLRANFRGVWLPIINEPLLRSFEPFADSIETYSPKDDGESFYSAFPQERHEFLFPKFKVNLRRTTENPNPMGAFEIIVLLDSKDTAIEVRDREVEFFDLLQRVFEEESFTDLESEIGKTRLKSRLKRELNQKLTQGWAKDINFKNFILKP